VTEASPKIRQRELARYLCAPRTERGWEGDGEHAVLLRCAAKRQADTGHLMRLTWRVREPGAMYFDRPPQ